MAPLTGTLEADMVTTIELGPRVYEVTVATDHDDIWFTIDGSDPYDGSPVAHHVLRYARSLTIPVGGGNETKLLKLWSATTPAYTVTVGAPADTSFTSLDHAGTDHTDIPGVGGGEGGVSIPESDTPPEDPEVGDLWLDTGTDAEQSGASVDWAAVEAETISLSAVGTFPLGTAVLRGEAAAVLASGEADAVVVSVSADTITVENTAPDGAVNISASGTDGIVNIEAAGTGGEVRVKLRSPDGTVFLLKVADDGTLSAQNLGGP